MTGATTSHPFPDNFWSSTSSLPFRSIPSRKKTKEVDLKEYVSSIDESPDFYDPYSPLNLFLSKKIKVEMQKKGKEKWSTKIQEELVSAITPEFQELFPNYRLGMSALKKTWEKISLYTQQLDEQPGSLTAEGTINVPFFIKENLKQYLSCRSSTPLHPSYFAHQLAMKLGEYLAAIDGIRPPLDLLTKTIWAVQRSLLPSGSFAPSPYDEYDRTDQLIVKTILEINTQHPHISAQVLEDQVKERLYALHELPSLSSLEQITANTSALLAEKLYPSVPCDFLKEQKEAMLHFIEHHCGLLRQSVPLTEMVRRIISLYSLANELPKNLSEEQLKAVIFNCEEAPKLPQAVYAFISAEQLLIFDQPIERVVEMIASTYHSVIFLPKLTGKKLDLLEIMIWNYLEQQESLLSKLPYRIGQKIEKEIASTLIENPHHSFATAVQATVHAFQKMKESIAIKKWPEIEKKIYNWVIQGDMVCRSISLETDTPLFQLARSFCTDSSDLSHLALVNGICQEYLRYYPELGIYSTHLATQVSILCKYIWYTDFATSLESSFDRFVKWHLHELRSRLSPEDTELLGYHLEEIISQSLPLTPSKSVFQ